MDTNKIWGFILIGVGVLFILSGLGGLYAAFTFSDQMATQMNALGNMTGNAQLNAEMAKITQLSAPSKWPGFFMLLIGGGCSYAGNTLLKKVSV